MYSDTTIHFYSDGSVDPGTGTVAAAYVVHNTTALFRLTDGSSILEAEVVPVVAALRHVIVPQHTNTIIYTGSSTDLQAITHQSHCDKSISLITGSHCYMIVARVGLSRSAGSQAMQE